MLALTGIELHLIHDVPEISEKMKDFQSGRYSSHPSWVAYEPSLLPPLDLIRSEGVHTLEEWYRWAEEWSMLLRVYGGLSGQSNVLEIGCGLGRIAFPLRYVLASGGTYDGFEICRFKVQFLESTFQRAYPHFRFAWADIKNTFYNPGGRIDGKHYLFPYVDDSFDIVYAASVFTHMLPDTAAHYFTETRRVLRSEGKAVFSFFLLDNYRQHQARPLGFANPDFNFDHTYGPYGTEFAIASPNNPEQMTAYKLVLLQRLADEAGLELKQGPIHGRWSGSHPFWIGAQDLVVFEKRAAKEANSATLSEP